MWGGRYKNAIVRGYRERMYYKRTDGIQNAVADRVDQYWRLKVWSKCVKAVSGVAVPAVYLISQREMCADRVKCRNRSDRCNLT